MPKNVKKRTQDEPLSPSTIYETIQAREFLQDLWWDLVSDIKEKPTYKRLKGMVDDVIHNNLKILSSKPKDNTEELRRQTILTEISMMTYAVDTVIHEVLYRKFENEYKSLISKMIDEALNENQSSSDQESTSMFEDIEKIFRNDTDKENNGLKSIADEEDVPSYTITSKTVSDGNTRKRGRPKKVIEEKMHAKEHEHTNSSPKRKRGRPRLQADHPGVIEKKKVKNLKSSQNSSKILNKKVKSRNEHTNQESDAESEISVRNLSLDTVSSVHTSELSSFEDAISICSDDGINGEKMVIPLKVANDMYVNGKLSQIYSIRKKGEKLKFLQADRNLGNSSHHNSKTVVLESRPQRNRKPNLKYNTDTMYCDVKDYSSSHADSGSSISSEMKDALASSPPRRQRKLLRRDKELSKSISKSKSSTKRYDSSDLYKPHSHNSRSTLYLALN